MVNFRPDTGPVVKFFQRDKLRGAFPRHPHGARPMSADPSPGNAALAERAFAEHYATQATRAPASMDAFWMPFTANKQFKSAPRLLASA